jgi:hypothetical protein
MDPNTPNAGSFMAPAGGGGAALQAAMASRSGGVTDQSTLQGGQLPSAPPPAPSNALPTSGQSAQAVLPPDGGMGATPINAGNPEAQKILSAMDGYLKSISKISEAQAGIR